MILRDALRRITPRVFFLAVLGNAALLLLGWAWLYIPDSHTWQFLFSMLFGAAILAAFLALYAILIRRLHPTGTQALWRSALVLAGWLLLAHILQHVSGLLSTGVETRAGYWNSQLSAHHRAFFTFERLTHWQNLVIETLVWIVIPALLLPFAVDTVARALNPLRARASLRTAAATLRRPALWLTVVLAYLVGWWFGNHLLAWRPGHSTATELLSLIVRVALVYCLAVALLLLTVTVVAELLTRASLQVNARRNTSP